MSYNGIEPRSNTQKCTSFNCLLASLLSISIHAQILIYMHLYTFINTHARTHVRTHTRTPIRALIHFYKWRFKKRHRYGDGVYMIVVKHLTLCDSHPRKCTHAHTHTHIHVHTHTHTHLYQSTYICTHTYIHTLTGIWIYLITHTHNHVYMQSHMYEHAQCTRAWVIICVCTHACTDTHAHTLLTHLNQREWMKIASRIEL